MVKDNAYSCMDGLIAQGKISESIAQGKSK